MSWLLIDYTDISLNNLEARKTYLYIRQQTPLHQILFNILTTSEITHKSESLVTENLKLYKQHHPKVSKLPNKPKNKMFKRNHNKNAKYMLKPCLKIIAYLQNKIRLSRELFKKHNKLQDWGCQNPVNCRQKSWVGRLAVPRSSFASSHYTICQEPCWRFA